MKRAATLCILVLLASCYGLERVDELRRAPAAPSAFHQELARLYLQFVDNELDKYDWDSAGYFAAKGIDAAHGKLIAPEDPAKWDIPAHASAELSGARARVIAKLSDDFMRQQPQTAARLLFSYDCWVEEQEEAWEQSAIDACKQQVMLSFSEVDAPLPMGGPLSMSYLFHFPEGKAELEGLARDELRLMAQTLASDNEEVMIQINGHADIPNSEALSAARANYVRAQLLKSGVMASKMRYIPRPDASAEDDVPAYAGRIEIYIE